MNLPLLLLTYLDNTMPRAPVRVRARGSLKTKGRVVQIYNE